MRNKFLILEMWAKMDDTKESKRPTLVTALQAAIDPNHDRNGSFADMAGRKEQASLVAALEKVLFQLPKPIGRDNALDIIEIISRLNLRKDLEIAAFVALILGNRKFIIPGNTFEMDGIIFGAAIGAASGGGRVLIFVKVLESLKDAVAASVGRVASAFPRGGPPDGQRDY